MYNTEFSFYNLVIIINVIILINLKLCVFSGESRQK